MKENSCAHHFEWFEKEMFEQPYLTLFPVETNENVAMNLKLMTVRALAHDSSVGLKTLRKE
jgi:hypothetical protein